MSELIPELNPEQWREAHTYGSAPNYTVGVTKAMELMTKGITNARLQIGGNITHLTQHLEKLNTNLENFNKSSGGLTEKALKLTWWIMGATVISAIATLILAVDVIVHWFK